MKRTVIGFAALMVASVAIISCGSSNSSTSSTHTLSGFSFRAFVTNALLPVGTSTEPVVQIIDAMHDVLATSPISLLGSSGDPVMMVVSPTLKYTMIFSPVANTITFINNQSEAIATSASGTSLSSIPLPGPTQSMAFNATENLGYAAVPTAEVAGRPPGAVVAVSVSTGQVTQIIPIPSAHYIAYDGSNTILVFSDNSDTVTLINTVAVGTGANPISYISGFDRPVGAIFNGSNAYILNCGPECGGTSAGVATLAMGSLSVSSTVPVAGATTAYLAQNALYVAGSPPGRSCGSALPVASCGVLSIISTSTNAVTGTATITDGYHNRMQMSENGQLFIGAYRCSAGCLSIFNTTNSSVVFPAFTGDVTGMQAITGRTVVYVCQGGLFEIYDTTTDQILVQDTATPLVITGDATDVKLVD